MTTLLTPAIGRIGIYAAFVVSVGCDPFRDEIPPDGGGLVFSQTDYYVVQGSSAIIDLKSTIERSLVPVSLRITGHPINGTLTEIDPLLFKYTPGPLFIEGKDQFVLSVVLDNGITNEAETITVHMKNSPVEFPCGAYSVEDFIRVKSPGDVVAYPLLNDQICREKEGRTISIHLEPKLGDAKIVGDSIIYTPGPSYLEEDELIYRLSTVGDEDPVFGLISINRTRVEVLKTPLGFRDIFFVDDELGYIAGSSIYKTIDGGMHWIELGYPKHESLPIIFEDIFFLNSDVGFAAFSECWMENDFDCFGGWMMTSNGGLSWTKIDMGLPVSSIFFTSPSVGYINLTQSDGWDQTQNHSLHKTEDGGKTWRNVVNYTANSDFKVRFANEKEGYAFASNSFFRTTDGGDNWTFFAPGGYVVSLSLTSNNIVSASISDGSRPITAPSSIMRSEDGVNWRSVGNYLYTILVHELSPSGEIGLAAGVSGTSHDSYIMTISKSMDKGQTWTDLKEQISGLPVAMSMPSDNVAYILCADKLIKVRP